MDTSTTSAVIVSALPPAAGSTVTVAPLPFASTLVTLVEVRNSMPCFFSSFAISVRMSGSMPGRIWSRYSTTVTFAPSLRHTEPSRSEEHTSELQSLMRISYAVFCLKKKKKKKKKSNTKRQKKNTTQQQQTKITKQNRNINIK